MSLIPTHRQRNLHQQAVDEIARMIVEGRFQQKQTLPDEESLGSRLGVSRTVVREAIKTLSAKGLVKARTKLGTVVMPDTDWNWLDRDLLYWLEEARRDLEFLSQLTEMRLIFEPAGAELAAIRATEDEIEVIHQAYLDMERNCDQVDVYYEADLGFHTAVLNASHNDFLRPMINLIRPALRVSLGVTNPGARHSRRILPEHFAVVDTIMRRDPPQAKQAMERHLHNAWQRIQNQLGTV